MLARVITGLVLALPACGDATTSASDEAPEPKPVFGGSPAMAALEAIPTQDEMDALAAERISEADAETVYEQLRAELLADPDAR